MKEVYFTLKSRRSIPTVRIEYGQEKKNFIVRIFDSEVNSRRTYEYCPKEEVFDDEQDMLKKVNEIKKGLLENNWIIKNRDSNPKHSFLKTRTVDGTISFEFSVNLDPAKLKVRKNKITKDFVHNFYAEIETNIRKGVKKLNGDCNFV